MAKMAKKTPTTATPAKPLTYPAWKAAAELELAGRHWHQKNNRPREAVARGVRSANDADRSRRSRSG
jgi:hypothetical protein